MYSKHNENLLKVLWELGKLKGQLRSLKIIISKPEIERNLLRSELQEVLTTLESLRTYLKRYIDEDRMTRFFDFISLALQLKASLFRAGMLLMLISLDASTIVGARIPLGWGGGQRRNNRGFNHLLKICLN
ncbi:MAG: hypothetical protein QXE01_03735 [Sulfolobales archaeon]